MVTITTIDNKLKVDRIFRSFTGYFKEIKKNTVPVLKLK